ncbi:hypothetical protein, partial [Microvirga tunisiensis]|uniref:hypothetical protein n=1 Tax=Microvirga tunisiensis TaxID=2108360 RepID=UPI0013869CA2
SLFPKELAAQGIAFDAFLHGQDQVGGGTASLSGIAAAGAVGRSHRRFEPLDGLLIRGENSAH